MNTQVICVLPLSLYFAQQAFRTQIPRAPVLIRAAMMKHALQVRWEERPAIVPTVFGIAPLVAVSLLPPFTASAR